MRESRHSRRLIRANHAAKWLSCLCIDLTCKSFALTASFASGDVSASNRRVKSWSTLKKILKWTIVSNCMPLKTCYSKLTSPFVSWNLGKVERISALEPLSLTSFWRCWKVSLIFWNIRDFSGVWLSKDMASLQASPSSCPSKLVALWHFGPPWETSWGLSSSKDPRWIFMWTVFIHQAMYPVFLAAS